MARKNIGQKVRFEVFKRDSFTCQYCGDSAPSAILHVDHISPVAGGGDNSIMNLITSCISCNLGKGAKSLSDKTAIEKQKKQLDALNEKRCQLEMLIKWREDLSDIKDKQIDHIQQIVFSGVEMVFSECGRSSVAKVINKYGFEEVVECAEISRQGYCEYSKGQIVKTSLEKVVNYIGRIAASRKKQKDNPELSKLYYIRGIVRNRMYCNDWMCLAILNRGVDSGLSTDDMSEIARTAKNWSQWKADMEEAMT